MVRGLGSDLVARGRAYGRNHSCALSQKNLCGVANIDPSTTQTEKKTCLGLSSGIDCVNVKHVMEFGMISKYFFLYCSFKKFNKTADLDKERVAPLATKVCKKNIDLVTKTRIVRDAKCKKELPFLKAHCQ